MFCEDPREGKTKGLRDPQHSFLETLSSAQPAGDEVEAPSSRGPALSPTEPCGPVFTGT